MSVTEPERGLPDGSEAPIERSETVESGPPRSTLFMLLRESTIVIALALLLSLIVKTWLMQAFYIPSESMENTLLKG